MKEHTNMLQRWSGPRYRHDTGHGKDRTPPVNRRHPGDGSFTAKPLRGLSLWILMAALALAASSGPARATTPTAVPNRPAGIGTLGAVNCSGTPVRTQHLERPDQVPDGLSPSDWASIRAAYHAGRHQ